MERKDRDNEIDLLKLFLQGVDILRANFWLFTCFFLLGIGLGFAHYYTSVKVFQNKLIVSSLILTRSYGKILIDNINKHQQENDITTTADKLKISEQTARKVSNISVETFIEADGIKETDRYIIIVEVVDEEILPELQQGLIYYLENNEFVRVRVEQSKRFSKEVISKIENELRDMEEFKTRLFKGDLLLSKSAVMFDPTTINSKIIELTKEKITLENTFALANSVQVIEGFTKFNKPFKPRLSVALLSGASLGLTFVFIILAFKSIRKLFRMADADKKSQA